MSTVASTSPPWLPEARQWARFVLDAPADFDAAEPHRLLLARLQEAEFVPVAQWEVAARLLVDDEFTPQPDQDLGYPFFFAFEARLHGLMSQFIAEFFQLAPDERRQKWQFLAERSRFAPALRWHLAHLKPGLDVMLPAEPTGDKYVDELLDHLRRAFPLPPPLKAAYNQAFLWRVAREPKPWPKAVKRLRRRHAAIAALQPEFCNQVADVSRKPRPVRQRQLPTAVGGASDGTPKWLVWVLIIIGIGIARSASESNRPRPTPTPPAVRPPQYAPYPSPSDPARPSDDSLRRRLEEVRRTTPPELQPLVEPYIEDGCIKMRVKSSTELERGLEHSGEDRKSQSRPPGMPPPITPLRPKSPLPAEKPDNFDPRSLRVDLNGVQGPILPRLPAAGPEGSSPAARPK